MIRWLLFGSVVLSLWCGCRRQVSAPPLSKDSMAAVLLDIHLIESFQQPGKPFEKGRSIKTLVEYDKVFQKHRVHPNDFYDAFEYYRQHPKELDEIYQHVIDMATQKQSELAGQATAERRRLNPADSTGRRRPNPAEQQTNEW